MTANNQLQNHLQELNPPVPPQAAALVAALDLDPVPISVRRLRVANGSKRKRDLAAVRMAEELELLERQGEVTSEIRETWETACELIKASIAGHEYGSTIAHLTPTGTDGEVLILTAAEQRVIVWAERRYSALIATALQSCSDFKSARFARSLEGPAAA